MSWDIFVQDVPSTANSVADIPSGFKPKPLGITRTKVVETVRQVAPFADCSDPSWVRIAAQGGCLIEVNLGQNENLDGFAFHVHGGDMSRLLIGEILERLGLRALDSASDSGFFAPETSHESFKKWQDYRTEILAKNRTT